MSNPSLTGTQNPGSSSGGSSTPADNSVTSAKIVDGAIVNADINAAAAIAATKISGTAITAADTGTVTSAMITDATITGTDIASSVALAGSPTTTTQATSDSSTKLATTAHVQKVAPYNSGFVGPAIANGANLLLTGTAVTAWPAANRGLGLRYVAPYAGTIDDVSFFVHASAGNYDLVIFDDGTLNAGKKTFLYHKGSTAVAGTDAWTSNNPGVVVTKGQNFDIGLSCSDATTAAILHTAGITAAADTMPAAYYVASGGALAKLSWSLSSVVPFTDQVAEASFVTTNSGVLTVFLVHITPS